MLTNAATSTEIILNRLDNSFEEQCRQKPQARAKRFSSWQELTITPIVELALLCLSAAVTIKVRHISIELSLFASLLLFYCCLAVFTLLLLTVLRKLFPLKAGVYSLESSRWPYYIYSLTGFLLMINLMPFYPTPLIPPPFRKVLYAVLGARFGEGLICISGRLYDPLPLISIEENVIIGEGAVICPHLFCKLASDTLVLGRIEIKSSAIIGINCTILPGVTVGENSMVCAMSLVPMNTHIPANEIWAGIPAKKIGDISV